MNYCLNPNCPKPDNPDHKLYCESCGLTLLLNGQYRILDQLGGGGFGKTYNAINTEGKSKVIKVLTLDHPIALRLFKQEYQVLSQLNHPGIPKVDPHGYFSLRIPNSQAIIHCLIMEKIEGETLEQYLEKMGKPLEQNLALNWLKQLAEILQEIHQQQFFHRDLKPSNIILHPAGHLVLIDFGTVKEITETFLVKQQKGQQGTVIYSVGYAPPEQEKGHTLPQSDFFALGRTFVQLLTNHHPLDFYNPHRDQLIWRSAVSHKIDILFLDFIDYLMADLPQDRPENPKILLKQLAILEQKLNYKITISQDIKHNKSAQKLSLIGIFILAIISLVAINNHFHYRRLTEKIKFEFDEFNNHQQLQFNGNATIINQGVRLVSANRNINHGSIFYKYPIQIKNERSWQTFFEFTISESGGLEGGGDGLTFIIQNSPNGVKAIGAPGAYLGYGNQGDYPSISPSVVIEFDTWYNPEFGDPNNNHLGINLNGNIISEVVAISEINFKNGEIIRVWIDYNGADQTLEIFINFTNNKPSEPLLVKYINLEKILGSKAYLGFSAGTWNAWGNHDLKRWYFEQ
jgi:serine/threonine protein kinase